MKHTVFVSYRAIVKTTLLARRVLENWNYALWKKSGWVLLEGRCYLLYTVVPHYSFTLSPHLHALELALFFSLSLPRTTFAYYALSAETSPGDKTGIVFSSTNGQASPRFTFVRLFRGGGDNGGNLPEGFLCAGNYGGDRLWTFCLGDENHLSGKRWKSHPSHASYPHNHGVLYFILFFLPHIHTHAQYLSMEKCHTLMNYLLCISP